MTYSELMIKSLSNILNADRTDQEVLKYPIYGTLLSKPRNYFGFFGMSEEHLLIALLGDDGKTIHWTARIPLDIKSVNIRKSMIPKQRLIDIEFMQGDPCRIRVADRVYKIPGQEENVSAFIKYLKEKTKGEA